MEYTGEQIEKMREKLAQRDIDQSDDGTLFDVFMDGCTGWRHFDDDFVIEQYEDLIGEEI